MSAVPAPQPVRPRAARALRSLTSPAAQTAALVAATTAAGLALLGRAPDSPLIAAAPVTGWIGVAALAVLFTVTELGQMHVEVRRQAYSFSLAGVPLLLGLLFCPPDVLVAVRLTAAGLAFAVQRMAPVKAAFNLAAYLLDVALVVLLTSVLVGSSGALDLSTAVAAYAALAISDVVVCALVLCVIQVNTRSVGREDVVDVFGSAAPAVLTNALLGVLLALLVSAGPLGWTVAALSAAVATATYRLHQVLRRRHASLQQVKDFIGLAEADGGAVIEADLAQRMLQRLRELVRAEHAQLLVPGGGGDGWVVAAHAHEDAARPAAPGDGAVTGRRAAEAPLLLAAGHGGVLVRAATKDPAHRAWLAAVGARDAVSCPLGPDPEDGVLVLTDRLGDTTTFTRDDLAMAQTLAGHLAVQLEAARMVERLRHDATHDPLTGLANRLELERRAAEALAAAAEGGPTPAVVAMHLSKVEDVIAVLGHHAGDELVVEVSRRLVEALPEALVARLGGEDFAVLVDTSTLAPLLAARAAASAVAEPVPLAATLVSTSATTGVAVATAGEDATALLRRAGTAESAARATRQGLVLHTPALDEGRAERVGLLADLHRAVEGDELDLHFQPKLDLALGLVTSAEALVRWDHPRLGRLAPDAFVPLAESTALVDPFSHLVLRKALRQARRWNDEGVDLSVAVNLSAHNVRDPQLPERVAAALATAGVPATRLILELTESSLVDDPTRTAEVLRRLAAIGVTISLDDFGTGYSSLSYLQRLPVSELKIDRSFVRGLETTASEEDTAVSAALIRSITSLKEVLGLRVVAEGVEDLVVLERLRDLGCDVIQGYLISRPRPADELDTSLFRPRAVEVAAPHGR